MSDTDIIGVINKVSAINPRVKGYSNLRSMELNSTSTAEFPLNASTRYNIDILIGYQKPNQTLTFYDDLGSNVFSYTIKQPTLIKFSNVNFSKITFKDSTQYTIGIFYSQTILESAEDAVLLKPDIAFNPVPYSSVDANLTGNSVGIASTSDISTLQTALTSANAGINVANINYTLYQPHVNTITVSPTDTASLEIPDGYSWDDATTHVMVQNLSSFTVQFGNSTTQPFYLSPMGIFSADLNNNEGVEYTELTFYNPNDSDNATVAYMIIM